jgi:hypothetical protein
MMLTKIWAWLKANPWLFLATGAVLAIEFVRSLLAPKPPAPMQIDESKIAKAEGRAEVQREQAAALDVQAKPLEAEIREEAAEAAEPLTAPPPAPATDQQVSDWLEARLRS